MMMAMVTFLVLSILVGELAYETGVYNGVVWRQVDQLRTRLLARSGLRLALLQVRAAEKAKEKAKALGLGDGNSLTDMIWKTPLVLPPPAPGGLGVNETQALDAFGKSLGLDGTVSVSIAGENGRINLNQIVWAQAKKPASGEPAPVPVGGQPPATAEQKKKALEGSRRTIATILNQLLEAKRSSDEAFRDRHGSTTGELLVGNLAAWMDPLTNEDGEGRQKKEYYSRLEPAPYAVKEAPLFSETELYMVKGFDDSLARLVADNFTVQSTGGVNVNEATPELLRAILPEASDVEIERIIARRTDAAQGGAFKDAAEFWAFLETVGNFGDAKNRLAEQGISILEKETSYRVVIAAQSGNASRSWVALIGPKPPTVDPEAPKAPGEVPAPAVSPGGDLAGSFEDNAKAADEANKNKAKNSSNSLNIIYLKAD
jgi:type II secretory pathway component PulK